VKGAGPQAARTRTVIAPTSSTLLDAEARGLPTVVRASPHYYNSEEEIARALEAIPHCTLSGSR
jgi:selenocysteine lyase/cysteine desulfurase